MYDDVDRPHDHPRAVLTDREWNQLLRTRRREPRRALQALRQRPRRPLLGADDSLLIVALDHTARGMLGVPGDPFAMADRRRALNALVIALSNPGVDGVLGSADVLEELALLGALDGRLVFGTVNRGGIAGASWELDDRITAYRPEAIAANGLDGAKVLLRLADDDPATAITLEQCGQVVDDCGRLGLPVMVEPLPYRRDPSGAARALDDDDALLRAVAIGAGLGSTSTMTWLKVPAAKDPARMLATTTLPALILGGSPGPDPDATFASWERALSIENACGLVVGRSLLFPADGDVAGAVARAAAIVRPTP
jgi:hypothetical protein